MLVGEKRERCKSGRLVLERYSIKFEITIARCERGTVFRKRQIQPKRIIMSRIGPPTCEINKSITG